jgi:chaperonin cofactor prefoldin
MVELLKRNHDVLMEKYELFRTRNEILEKVALEKEKLYNEIKVAHDQASQRLYSTTKQLEEVRNQREVLEVRVRNLEDNQKSREQQLKTLKT